MGAINTSLSVSSQDQPIINPTNMRRLAGAVLLLSRADFDTAITNERALIASNGFGLYSAGQRIEIIGEIGQRIWTVGTGGDSASIAAASHGKVVELRPGLVVVLANDSNTVTAVSGAPSGGSAGDVKVDYSANSYYINTAGTWGVAQTIYPGVGGSTSAAVAFSTALPMDGKKFMTPTPNVLTPAMLGATTRAFTQVGSAVIDSQCNVKIASDGTVVPTFPAGWIEWGGSAGWTSAAGTINNLTAWYDGYNTYYSWGHNASAPVTLPVPTVAAKTGVGAGTLSVTLSAAADTQDTTAPDPAAFTVTTVNVGSQTDTVSAATLIGTLLTLSTSRGAVSGDATAVSYDPTTGALAKRLVDASGNLLFAWANLPCVVNSFIGLLDSYSSNMGFAYGLERLVSTYTGPLIRVANSGGTGTNANSTFDIPYNAAGQLDTTVLPTGGTNTVTVLYDQSGGAHNMLVSGATPLSTTAGPGGTRPALTFNGTNYFNTSLGASIYSTLFGASGEFAIYNVDAFTHLNSLGIYGGLSGPSFRAQSSVAGGICNLGVYDGQNDPTIGFVTYTPGQWQTGSAIHSATQFRTSLKVEGALWNRSTLTNSVTQAAVTSDTTWQWHTAGGGNAVPGKGYMFFGLKQALTDIQRDNLDAALATLIGF